MTSLRELTKNIVDCGYECEAGALENNLDFRALVQRCQIFEDALVQVKESNDLLLRQINNRLTKRDES